jgi:hypothetical protein
MARNGDMINRTSKVEPFVNRVREIEDKIQPDGFPI